MSRKNSLLVIITLFFLAMVSSFVFRDALLNYFVCRKQAAMLDRYDVSLEIKKCGFEGIRDIYIENLSLVPVGLDTLLYISKVKAKLNLAMLFRFKIGFNELLVDTILVNAMKYDNGLNNYSMLFKGAKKDTVTEEHTAVQYNDRIASILKKAGNIFNERVVMHAVRINYTSGGRGELLSIPELFFDKEKLSASIVTVSSDGVGSYIVNSKADPGNDSYDFIISSTGNEKASLPFFDLYDNFKIGFDKIHVNFKADRDENVIPINVMFDFTNLRLNQWRISPVNVSFPQLKMVFNLLVDEHRISFNKGTSVQFARLPINIDGFYENKPGVRIGANVAFNCDAGSFFSSLPNGMFNSLQGLKASGELHYSLNFDVDKNNPDNVVFESSLKKEHFRIIQFGQEYFPLINSDFQYTAMEKDKPVRIIYVGTSNPMFTPYTEISDYLKNSILTSEDPGFMTHNGFVESAFRESIAKNIKEGRFARGGSTISMQLVKNLFLNRNKTISRKLEEALIVWLIEQNNLVSKERMFEIYLNIIEWGPGVYGIGEASHFYFNKTPKDLSLPESVFLASIIPHPKYFKYMFDSTGTMKESQQAFYHLIANRMVTRNLIAADEISKADSIVKIKGPAFNLIIPLDSLPKDTMELEDDE